jgi:secreted trypsin-like serine protease
VLNFISYEGRKSNIKQKVTIPIVDLNECNRKYEQTNKIVTNNQLCAGGEMGKDSCNGDSGGPLMKYNFDGTNQFWFVAGVVSYGTIECGTGVPGVYTKVSSYMDWIKEQIKP